MPANSTAVLIFATMADVTWRLFVPSIGCTILGVVADRSWGTKPWMTIIGVGLGIALSYVLVAQQIKKIKAAS